MYEVGTGGHQFNAACIPMGCTIRNVMESLDESALGVVLIVDSKNRLQGTMTDGDIRRALLKGASMDSEVTTYMRSQCTTVAPLASRAQVLDLMKALKLNQIPIIDENGYLVGLHLIQEVLGSHRRSNWALIMAGGLGTRLGELTKNTPKPMLKVAGTPILERLVLHFVGFGVQKIFLAVNYLSEVIEEHFGNGERFGCQIDYVREEEALGTGGALALLPETPPCPIFVANGDLVTQANLEDMLTFHETKGFGMTMAVHNYAHQIPYGCVEHSGGRISELVEKPTLLRSINAGMYVINPDLLDRVPKKYFPITELVSMALAEGIPVGAWEVSEEWIDVGQRDELKRARSGS